MCSGPAENDHGSCIPNLDLDHHIVEVFLAIYINRKFADFGKSTNDILDSAGNHVYTANQDHVIDSTDHSAIKPDERALT